MTYTPKPQAMLKGLWFIALASLALQPWAGAAQTLTGGVQVTVRDPQGLVVAGAQVRVTSTALIGGPLSETTDAYGQLRLPALPPGSYTLEVTMPSFAPSRATISIATALVYTDIGLKISLSEDVAVSGTAGDVRPGFGSSVTPDQLQNIPTRRNGPFALIGEQPGISPTSQATVFVSAFGSGVDQNAFLFDGINVTASSNGIARSEPGIDFIQEMHLQSVGASAEYGNVQGAVVEFITRQGGDRFAWDGSFYGQPRFMASQPFTQPIDLVGPLESGYERREYSDVSTTFGGPAWRNRLWFFGGYQNLRDQDVQPGANPEFPKTYAQEKVFGKLTWRLAPNWNLVQSFHGEYWDNRELPTNIKLVEATQRLQASVPAVTIGRLTHVISPNRFWEVSAGWFRFNQDITRVTGDSNAPGVVDKITNQASGAPGQLGELKQTRWTAKTTLNEYRPGMLGANHDIRVGGQFERGEHRSLLVVPTGVRYEKNPDAKIAADAANAGGLFYTGSVFATDAFTFGNRLTITGGLRFDHSRAISPDVERLRADGSDTGELIPGAGHLYSWNVVSPRVGAALKLTADGRTILRGSYGKFSQGVLTGELSANHPGQVATTTFAFDANTGDYTKVTSVVDPRVNVRIDPGTRAPRTDAYSVGVDREVGRGFSTGVVYVYKRGTDFIGWEDAGGTYKRELRTIDGRELPVFILMSGPASRLFKLTNPSDYGLNYNGVAMTVDKRLSRNWQTSTSYTWSRATGLQPSGGTTAAGAQVATVGAPPVSFAPPVMFGRDPNALTNAGGQLANDRPNLFRVMSSVNVPKISMMFAGNLQHASGKPWAETTDLDLKSSGQGTVRLLLEPRGTQRLSSQTVLDLRASWTCAFAGAGRLELRFDVLNALNDTAEESIASDRFDSPNLGTGNVFLDPRRVMLSATVRVGK